MPIIGKLTTDSIFIALSGFVIVLLMLAILALLIVIMSRVVGWFSNLAGKPIPAGGPAIAPLPSTPIPMTPAKPIMTPPALRAQTAPYGGKVELSQVDDLTAACIMAIVSNETGIPLEQLVFKSIKAL